MRTDNKERLIYKSDGFIKQIRANIFIFGSYMFLIWLWQFTLSYQSSMYSLMNVAVFAMWLFGAVGSIISKEEREVIIKHTKSQITYYLIVTFVYDMFLKVVILDMTNSVTGNEVDPSLMVARQFLLVVSTMLKIGFPIAYIIWMLQKIAIFRGGLSKKRQMEILRDVRENFVSKDKKNTKTDKDNINRY